MALNERQNNILSILKEEKSAQVTKLAKRLFVSEATIRRDLAEMESIGLVERSHGGALLPENSLFPLGIYRQFFHRARPCRAYGFKP